MAEPIAQNTFRATLVTALAKLLSFGATKAATINAGATLGAGAVRGDLFPNEYSSLARLSLYYIPDSLAASIAVGDC